MAPSRKASVDLLTVPCATLTMLGLWTAFSVASATARTGDATSGKVETYKLMIYTNPADGKEDEYNKWYDEHHAPDVVANPGFVNAQRFVVSDKQLQGYEPPRKYLVIYTIMTDNLPYVNAENARRLRNGIIPVSPVLGRSSTIAYTYKTIGPLIEHQDYAVAVLKGELQTYYLLVFSNSVPGKEEEYNRWYSDAHAVRVIVTTLGFVNGQLLELMPAAQGISGSGRASTSNNATTSIRPQYKHLMMFKIATDNLESVFKAFNRRSLKKVIGPASSTSVSYTFKTLGPLIDGDKVRATCAGITDAPCP